jgi:translation elongation factor P/translation initiation factor 5A
LFVPTAKDGKEKNGRRPRGKKTGLEQHNRTNAGKQTPKTKAVPKSVENDGKYENRYVRTEISETAEIDKKKDKTMSKSGEQKATMKTLTTMLTQKSVTTLKAKLLKIRMWCHIVSRRSRNRRRRLQERIDPNWKIDFF